MLKIKNTDDTPVVTISEQMNEARPLPMGRQEFEDWSNRIISGALVSALPEDQKYVLANLIMSLGPTEDHKPDIFFIKSLRKAAVNQVADVIRVEYREAKKLKMAAEQPVAEATQHS